MNYDTPLIDRDNASAGQTAAADDTFVRETHIISEDDAVVQDRRRKQIMIVGGVVTAIIAAIILFMVLSKDDGAAAEDANAAQIPVVSVIVPGSESVTSGITASGTLSARNPLPVGSVGEGGQVVSVRVEEGDWVSQGQVLAVIDRSVQTQQAAGQAAQVQVARADANLAQANLDRALKLVDRGFISKADVDRLRATRDAASARVRVAEASLGELNARNARLNILAPAGGLVLTRDVEVGQVVSGGSQPLFVIAKGGEMELAALVGESDLARLTVGAPATVKPVGTEREYAGQVWQLSPTIDETSRQGEARVALAYDRALRPGGFATASIGTGGVNAPVLPESAIQTDAKGSYVFIVDKQNKVRRRAVRTGLVTSAGITVAEGLTGNERVVLLAGGFLFEGDEVKPQITPRAN
jgi:HlyD family secretion protein